MTILEKTDAGRDALSSNTRLLTPRERTMVLLADGRRTLQELCGMVAGATPESLYALRERGFLDMRPAEQRAEPSRPRRRVASLMDGVDSAPPSEWGRNPAAELATPPEPTAGPVEVLAEATPIEALARIRWARTPAATKLYLMDVVERTFAASDRAQWERLRELLREVRDEDSLSVAMDMVTHAIACAAGEDRAQALRQQLVL